MEGPGAASEGHRPVRTRRGQWFGISWKGDPARSGTIIFNIGIHLLDGLTCAIGAAPEVIRAHADPAGDYAEGRLQFGAVTVDWTLSTRETDLPAGTRADAARYIAVDGDIICDFSDYSRLHSIVYQEIIAGRGTGSRTRCPRPHAQALTWWSTVGILLRLTASATELVSELQRMCWSYRLIGPGAPVNINRLLSGAAQIAHCEVTSWASNVVVCSDGGRGCD